MAAMLDPSSRRKEEDEEEGDEENDEEEQLVRLAWGKCFNINNLVT